MGVSKPQAPRPRSAGNQAGILELYQQCFAAEGNLTKEDMGKLKLILVRGLLFDRPLFGSPPTVDESSAINKEIDLKIRRQLWEAGKYRAVLDLVGRQTKRENRLFLLACWLKQEKVCEPEDLLGIEVLRRLVKENFRFLSASDFYHAERVRKCLPYVEKLLADFRTRKGDVSKLVNLGYDEVAIRAVSKKRSATPAACEWLANRRDSVSNVDALTLQNAYSRVYGPKRRSVHESHTSH